MISIGILAVIGLLVAGIVLMAGSGFSARLKSAIVRVRQTT